MPPHNMRFPPPNLAVSLTVRPFSFSPDLFQTHMRPSEPRRFTFVSSEHTTTDQSASVQCLYFRAKSILALRCRGVRKGFFCLSAAFISSRLRALCTVSTLTVLPVRPENFGAAPAAVSSSPEVIVRVIARQSRGDRMRGRSDGCFLVSGQSAFI